MNEAEHKDAAQGAQASRAGEAMPMDEAALKLENQLCFPLYAAAREVVNAYRPLLEALELTYTQYIALMALWEHGELSVGEMGARLKLDSGTLTPLLKRMEARGLIRRARSARDEREVHVTLTAEGQAMKQQALPIPYLLREQLPLSDEEAFTLYKLLYKLLGHAEEGHGPA
ncbi:MAG TPA: MarR family transcriptional regulator [Candidatus Limnocylindria bacterium]|nr:MarR family transcriptional regulator [Candidatus Limnocylindria bacterium]